MDLDCFARPIPAAQLRCLAVSCGFNCIHEKMRYCLWYAESICIVNARKQDGQSDALAPQVGLEPTTLRLTAECSTIELLRSNGAEIKLTI